jgi:hypothetical protein
MLGKFFTNQCRYIVLEPMTVAGNRKWPTLSSKTVLSPGSGTVAVWHMEQETNPV